jgi:hypothetical protein
MDRIISFGLLVMDLDPVSWDKEAHPFVCAITAHLFVCMERSDQQSHGAIWFSRIRLCLVGVKRQQKLLLCAASQKLASAGRDLSM